MKLTDKRFWIFEVMMLLCGVATACVESLNYGLVRFISSAIWLPFHYAFALAE